MVIKGTRNGNLYYLNGTIVVEKASMASSKDLGSSKLWHMRLGHTGEK